MSTGFECEFYNVQEKGWFYLLQDWTCPVGTWDWREYCTAYGPFKSYEDADKHLFENHANPGGSTDYKESQQFEDLDESVQGAILQAEDPRRGIW